MEHLRQFADEELVKLFATGCNDAFDVLLERYKDKLYSNIFYTVRNADLADDIFQETFVKAIVTIRDGNYQESGKFFPWISRIAYNLVIDQFRTEKNARTISNEEVDYDLFNNIHLSERNILNVIESEQTSTDLHRMINHLPEEQKEIVVLHYFKNMTFKEIADSKSISINTALGRMRYSILNLRKMALKYNIVLTH